MFNQVFASKVKHYAIRKLDAFYGSIFYDLHETIEAMTLRPFELHLELTNICNANCIFCPYQYQQRPQMTMSDEVFYKVVADYVDLAGGSVGLTPIVGDALIDPNFFERVHFLRSQPEIDRIFLTTNGILLDRVGIDAVLDLGLTTINISTSGFNKADYKRVYRSTAYKRMKNNVTELVAKNAERGYPVNISIALRNDRPLADLLAEPDFQPILKHKPNIDFTWAFTTAGGRVKREDLPRGFRLRSLKPKNELCEQPLNGCIVLPDGTVQGCSCVASMDAGEDLKIGHILEQSLLEIYTGELLKNLLDQFRPGGCLNETCANCDMYQAGLELYRTREGRARAELNRRRFNGEIVHRSDEATSPFAGG